MPCDLLNHFNPRTPRGVRQCPISSFATLSDFNPRTPRGVRPTYWVSSPSFSVKFQSTHPARGATSSGIFCCVFCNISIHAPREGCDTAGHVDILRIDIISIHAPREGCDDLRSGFFGLNTISIHAPREGCDIKAAYTAALAVYFNPRTPRGVRPERVIL